MDLDLEDATPNSPYLQKQDENYQNEDDIYLLKKIRKGNLIVFSKEYKLVFYITCFVPFIRPNLP